LVLTVVDIIKFVAEVVCILGP